MQLRAGGRGVSGYLFQRDLNRAANAGPDGKTGIADVTTSTQITQAHVDQLEDVDTLPDPLRTLTQAEVSELTGYAADNCGANAAGIPCHDDYMDDLTFDFGRPGPDPDGEPGYFWSAKVGLDGRDEPDRDKALANGAPYVIAGGAEGTDGVTGEWKKRGPDTGEIAVYMSNYAGVDNKGILDRLEREDDPGKDEARYLDYMSYGMFGWTDYLTTHVRPFFSQGFHFGYDAFADTAGNRVSDLTESQAVVFHGEMMGMVLHPFRVRDQVMRTTRIRGDVALTACIGGSGCTHGGSGSSAFAEAFSIGGPNSTAANKIRGLIQNIEYRPSGSDSWRNHTYLNPGITLTEADIRDDGSFREVRVLAGTENRLDSDTGRYRNQADFDGVSGSAGWSAADGTPASPDFNGSWGGNFYGPKEGALEVGGWFHLYPRAGGDTGTGLGDWRHSGVVGSFGAKKVTRGARVTP